IPSLKVLGLTLLFTALGGFGTTICYHRLLAHRTFKVNKFIEHFLTFWAMFNGSGAPASWVAYHRHHHSRADTPEDISSPKHGGFWWAHLRWLYQSPRADVQKWAPDLTKGFTSSGCTRKARSSCSRCVRESCSAGKAFSGPAPFAWCTRY